jgi:cytochrome c biogenesis protein CcdA/thiol-disulfide isomerase/thioredoxin
MTLFVLAYLAGVLTIATPCIFPILPFVLARAGEPFRRGALPMLLGMALAFAATASLASVAGGWAIEATRYGRIAALALTTLFGLAMLMPALAARMAAPLVSIGSGLSTWARQRRLTEDATAGSSMLLGVATGLVWAPCAGPVLGLVLTGAALHGPSVESSLLLLTYGLGAATSLGAGLAFGRRLFAGRLARWGDSLLRILGAAVVAGAATIWLGLDTGLLPPLSSISTNTLEQDMIATVQDRPALEASMAAQAATDPALSAPLDSLFGAQHWLNTQPLRPEDLRGKVVLINFWTYSCINCLRLLPYAKGWAEKYKDRGLAVIGVHTPEFAFEKDVANVSKAVAALGVRYPVAIDSDYRIWRAFNNAAWPALYFIGTDGRLRHHDGEGSYDQSEQLIQRLLSQADGTAATGDIAAFSGTGAEAALDQKDLGSGETYIGYTQARNFASPDDVRADTPTVYRAMSELPLNRWSLAGVWTIGGEFATLSETPGRIIFRFHARDLHLVLAPPSQGHPIRFRVKIDGAPPGADHGFDVDAEGWGSVQDGRLYQLVRQTGAVADRTFEIEFFDAGVRAYAFTFG